MANIYTIEHPYYTPGKNGSYPSNPSLAHQLIFGRSVDESFPEHLEIITGHESSWNYIDGSWQNKREEKFVESDFFIELGDFLRKHMIDDVFLFTRKVEYSFDTRNPDSVFSLFEKQYYETNDHGKLIRLPVSCAIQYVEIRFRDPVDKTQFLLINSGNYQINDEVYNHSMIKHKSQSYYNNNGKDILCPCCKVNFDEEKYKETI